MPDGRIAYTRSGALSRNEEGVLTTPSGYVVQPEIQIPEGVTSINISASGNVSVTIGANNAAQEIGQLTLANFTNLAGLQPIGENMLVETDASGPPVIANPLEQGFGKLVQGALESSNVNVCRNWSI